ncbi:MAG: hypothetical protein IH984_00525 [Planctomycetes bacterium]|nr:hypothetical protein [Planctomycetota bacterium]
MQRNSYYKLPQVSIRIFVSLLIADAMLASSNCLYAQCPVAELVAYNANPWGHFGKAVATSNDGAVVLIGAPKTLGGTYLFVREGLEYLHLQQLIPADLDPADTLGVSVALSYDGTTAIITASDDDDDVKESAAYVFVKSGETWIEQAKLLPPKSTNGTGFGGGEGAVLSAGGNTAVIGALLDDEFGQNAGAAHIFERNPETSQWSHQVKLLASDGEEGDWYGRSVDISGDGNIIVAGAFTNDSSTGAAYINIRDPQTSQWTEQIKLTASDGQAGAQFGYSVAISGDGSTILVGARNDDDGAGAAYVFIYDGDNWIEQAKLTDFIFFGTSVDISADGESAVIGSILGNGAASYFTRHSGAWFKQSRFRLCNGFQTDLFGEQVEISGDGKIALIGARLRDLDYFNQGAAYVFDLTGSACSDISGDGIVDITDLVVLLALWGECGYPFTCPADLNGDCTTNVRDLLILFANWG